MVNREKSYIFNEEESRRSSLTQRLILITLLMDFIWGALLFFMDMSGFVPVILIVSLGYIAALILIKSGQIRIAKITYILFACILSLMGTFFIGPAGRIELTLLGMSGMPFLIFSFKHELKYIIGSVIIIFSCLLMIYVLDFNFYFLNHVDQVRAAQVLYPMCILSVMSKVVYEISYFAKLSSHFENRIKRKRLFVESTTRAKSTFLNTMSHEIKTPLNAVIGLPKLLLLQEPREDQKINLQAINQSGERLMVLLTDILDYNRLESNLIELEKSPLQFSEITSKLNERYIPLCELKGIDFSIEVKHDIETIDTDIHLLFKVLDNLLSNAVKFTPSGEIRFKSELITNSLNKEILRFSIEDTGIGIPQDYREQIFELFTQKSTGINRKYEGTGLGLAICQKILSYMNSTVKLTDQSELGTCFYFDLELPYN